MTLAQGVERPAQSGFSQRAAERDARSRWEAALGQWAAERRRIQDRIADVRGAQARQDLEELERLRADAERVRSTRLRTAAAVVVLVAAPLFLGPAWDTPSSTPQPRGREPPCYRDSCGHGFLSPLSPAARSAYSTTSPDREHSAS